MKDVPQILLIDDSTINQMLCSKIFSQFGWNIKGVKLGKKAVEVLETSRFDVIILDLELPDLHGLELAAHLRNGEGQKVPIIALSGNDIEPVRDELEKLSIEDYLIKPLDYDNLVAIVTKHLK